MQAAIAELTGIISARYPDATFTTEVDEHDEAVFVTAVVDLADPAEVVDLIIDREVTLQVDEGLPLHILPGRTPERNAKLLAEMRAAQRYGSPRHSVTG
jgi:hypothetical protein